jgi:predicted MFS family arabinose efflux permease
VSVAPRTSRRTAGLSIALALVLCAGTFTPSVLGALGPFITRDLGISAGRFGLLPAAMFVVAGAGSLLAGPLSDRLGPRRLVLVLCAMSAATLVGMATAQVLAALAGAMVFAGVAMAITNPATNLLIQRHVDGPQRGFVTGVKQAGNPLSALLAGATLPTGAALLGWRPTLLVALALPAVTAGLVLTTIPSDGVPGPAVRHGSARPTGPLGRPLALYAFFMGAAVAGVATYLPLYAYERVAFTGRAAGMLTAVVGLVGIVSRVAWGHLSARWEAAAPLAVISLVSLAAASMFAAAEYLGGGLLWLGAVAFGATGVSWIAVAMLAIVRGDPVTAGRTSGVVQMAFYVGLTISPILFGLAIEATGSYLAGWVMICCMAAAAGVTAARWGRSTA